MNMPSKRIALFGGAFDPPHFGHVLVITTVLNSRLVDEIWVVPVGDSRTDKSIHASAKHRQKMVELMISSTFDGGLPIFLKTVQLDEILPGSYTIDLLDHMKRKHPSHTFFLVIGSDALSLLPKWKEAGRLMDEAKFLVVARPTDHDALKLPKNVEFLSDGKEIGSNISSSVIRRFINEGKQLYGLVPKDVLVFVKHEKLYKDAV